MSDLTSSTPSSHSVSEASFTIALVFFFFMVIIVFFIILYLLLMKPTVSNNFVPTKIKPYPSSITIDNRTYKSLCQTSNDCPINTVCVDGSCTPINLIHKLPGQCQSHCDCPTGQGCFNGVCKYPVDDHVVNGMITYFSPAQLRGNIAAPESYLCSESTCGVEPIKCDSNTKCPNGCSSCVNGYCRCTPGAIFESCENNTDCTSGFCQTTSQGKFCVGRPDYPKTSITHVSYPELYLNNPSSSCNCLYNYNGKIAPDTCPPDKPYCVNGTCSDVSLGAFCGGPDLPDDMCSNPSSLSGLSFNSLNSTNKNGMGNFCVNGVCRSKPGRLNELCKGNSCKILEYDPITGTSYLTCAEITRNNKLENRCIYRK